VAGAGPNRAAERVVLSPVPNARRMRSISSRNVLDPSQNLPDAAQNLPGPSQNLPDDAQTGHFVKCDLDDAQATQGNCRKLLVADFSARNGFDSGRAGSPGLERDDRRKWPCCRRMRRESVVALSRRARPALFTTKGIQWIRIRSGAIFDARSNVTIGTKRHSRRDSPGHCSVGDRLIQPRPQHDAGGISKFVS
jgi:hypothetical protein